MQEVCVEFELCRQSASQILQTLARRGFVEKVGNGSKYASWLAVGKLVPVDLRGTSEGSIRAARANAAAWKKGLTAASIANGHRPPGEGKARKAPKKEADPFALDRCWSNPAVDYVLGMTRREG
jgi:hypothetical protein